MDGMPERGFELAELVGLVGQLREELRQAHERMARLEREVEQLRQRLPTARLDAEYSLDAEEQWRTGRAGRRGKQTSAGRGRRTTQDKLDQADGTRIVCATNRDLQDMVDEDSFREDLSFRVNTFEIRLPALRNRKDDIPALARTLIARHVKRPTVPDDILSPDTIRILRSHDWSGNVRELANALEHATILAGGETILAEHLPIKVGGLSGAAERPFDISNFPRALTLNEIEQQVIEQTREKHEGDKPATSDELGIALKTLYNKLNQYQTQAHAG